MIMVVPSSSLLYGLGRGCRVKIKPLRGRFANLDTAAAPREMAAIEEDGEKQGAMIGAGQPKITGH